MAESILKAENRLNYPVKLKNSKLTNWNDVSEVGWYSSNSPDTLNKHSDMGNAWIQAINLPMNNNPNFKYVIAFGNNHIFVRSQNNGTWGGWVKLV